MTEKGVGFTPVQISRPESGGLEAPAWETSENYLGVAPIRSGDAVIVRKKPGIAVQMAL